MKDSERLTPQAAMFILAQTTVILRHIHNGNLTEVWHGLSRLDMAAYKAAHLNQPLDQTKQLRLFP